MECRPGCGACCVAISISSYIPGMPDGKPAGVRCLWLTDKNFCGLFGRPKRPEICSFFSASPDTCGGNSKDAFALISAMELATAPSN